MFDGWVDAWTEGSKEGPVVGRLVGDDGIWVGVGVELSLAVATHDSSNSRHGTSSVALDHSIPLQDNTKDENCDGVLMSAS